MPPLGILDSPALRSTTWSVAVRDIGSGDVLWQHRPDTLLRTASVAKVFVLVELADAIGAGRLAEGALLDRREVAPVADSGLWQHLTVPVLPAGDVARLVGTVSDNWATNVLINRLGLDAVQARAQGLAQHG
jgi:beta-lactamase class A